MADATIWSKRVAAWRASGQTAAEYSERHGIGVSALRYWSRRCQPTSAPNEPAPMRIVRVERAKPAVEPLPSPPIAIEVSGARILVARGVDRETLSTVLAAVAGAGR